MKYIKVFLPLALFAILYFYVFTGERTINYYIKGDCVVTRVDYESWGNSWTDLYYGKLDYEDINESRCFIRCEVRGGIDCMMSGYLLFKHDSIFVVPYEGGFFKYNCGDDKLYLLNSEYLYDEFYFDYGYSRIKEGEKSKEYKKHGLDAITLPTQSTLKFFNTMSESNSCSLYESVHHKYIPDPCLVSGN